MSDHVAIMNEGRFEQIGRPEELYHPPNTAFVAGFVGDSNRWTRKVTETHQGVAKVTTNAGMTMLCQKGDIRNFSDAQNVKIYVRPEFITATRTQTSDTEFGDLNTLNGKVDSVLFNGINSCVLVRGIAPRVYEFDFGNYIDFFQEPIYWNSLLRTGTMSILVTFLALMISFPIAYYIAKIARLRSKGALFLLCLIPLWFSDLIRAFG